MMQLGGWAENCRNRTLEKWKGNGTRSTGAREPDASFRAVGVEAKLEGIDVGGWEGGAAAPLCGKVKGFSPEVFYSESRGRCLET